MLRVALIDDEAPARRRLRQLIEGHPGLRIAGEADGFESGCKLLSQENVDAVFLDIQMPGASGFDLLQKMTHPLRVVIVTAHAQHAIQAFEVEAVDFLLKPIRPARFAQAVRRLEAACAQGGSGDTQTSYAVDDRICLQTPQRTLVVPVSSLGVLEADGDFTRIFVRDSETLMICRSIRFYEEQLPHPPFVRLDRSLLINVEAIQSLDRKSRDEAILQVRGVRKAFPLGRTAQARLREVLGDSRSKFS